MNDLTLRDKIALSATEEQWRRHQKTRWEAPSEDEILHSKMCAMAGVWVIPMPKQVPVESEEVARYRFADAMLLAREAASMIDPAEKEAKV